MEELIKIQSELKAPKGQFNSFGKYKYRSAEDILEAVKPLLEKNDCTLTLSDELELIGERYYVKATATLKNGTCAETVTAYAREEAEKRGMDGSQITGTASSYARKYALNGLFCIDDTKDADTDEYTAKTKAAEKPAAKKAAPKASDGEMTYREKVIIVANEKGISPKELAAQYKLNGKTDEARFAEVLADLEAR